MKVSEILKSKGGDVMTVSPDTDIGMLAHRLRTARVGAMPVVSGGKLEGIISERDVTHGLAEHGAKLLTMPVEKLMTRGVITVAPEDTLARVARLMTDRRIRHLPVIEGGALVGMVSIGDVVKHRLAEVELTANVMQDLAIARG